MKAKEHRQCCFWIVCFISKDKNVNCETSTEITEPFQWKWTSSLLFILSGFREKLHAWSVTIVRFLFTLPCSIGIIWKPWIWKCMQHAMLGLLFELRQWSKGCIMFHPIFLSVITFLFVHYFKYNPQRLIKKTLYKKKNIK